MGITKDTKGNQRITSKTKEDNVLAAEEQILQRKLERQGGTATRLTPLISCACVSEHSHEEFHVLWLDNRHRIPYYQRLFNGTVDDVSVHRREVVRLALEINAAAAILAHDHPRRGGGTQRGRLGHHARAPKRFEPEGAGSHCGWCQRGSLNGG